MTSLISRIAVVMTIAVMTAITAQAQTTAMRVMVPFPFHTVTGAMPAGEYRVEIDSEHHRIALHSRGGDIRVSLGAFLADRPAAASTRAALFFNRYGNRYFLLQVCADGAAQGYGVQRSKAEREMAKGLTPQELARIEGVSN